MIIKYQITTIKVFLCTEKLNTLIAQFFGPPLLRSTNGEKNCEYELSSQSSIIFQSQTRQIHGNVRVTLILEQTFAPVVVV